MLLSLRATVIQVRCHHKTKSLQLNNRNVKGLYSLPEIRVFRRELGGYLWLWPRNSLFFGNNSSWNLIISLRTWFHMQRCHLGISATLTFIPDHWCILRRLTDECVFEWWGYTVGKKASYSTVYVWYVFIMCELFYMFANSYLQLNILQSAHMSDHWQQTLRIFSCFACCNNFSWSLKKYFLMCFQCDVG